MSRYEDDLNKTIKIHGLGRSHGEKIVKREGPEKDYSTSFLKSKVNPKHASHGDYQKGYIEGAVGKSGAGYERQAEKIAKQHLKYGQGHDMSHHGEGKPHKG